MQNLLLQNDKDFIPLVTTTKDRSKVPVRFDIPRSWENLIDSIKQHSQEIPHIELSEMINDDGTINEDMASKCLCDEDLYRAIFYRGLILTLQEMGSAIPKVHYSLLREAEEGDFLFRGVGERR